MDAEGRVHGAERLSVVDASIMPDVPSGFTHFPTIMLIAERLSESLVAFVKFGHSRSRSGPLPGHSRGTESRNQEDLGGPGRTRSRQQSNTSGHLRSREDTGGQVINTVRDREAPGSNPGPPTNPEAGDGAGHNTRRYVISRSSPSSRCRTTACLPRHRPVPVSNV